MSQKTNAVEMLIYHFTEFEDHEVWWISWLEGLSSIIGCNHPGDGQFNFLGSEEPLTAR